MPKILLVGSIAFDVIFSISEDFRDSIPLRDGKIRNFNASYLADEKREHFGGTAGNIGFWCGVEKCPTTIFSAVGRDFDEKKYRRKLENLGVEIRGATGDFTAHAYLISDPLHQQLIIWQPNFYAKNESQRLADHFTPAELAGVELAIFSAGTPASIASHLAEFRVANPTAKIILDPGQISQFFEPEKFKKCAEKSDILIGNDIEFLHFEKYFDGKFPPNLKIIETLGDRGVNFDGKNYPAEKVEKVVETTGAGDAFRAGFAVKFLETRNFEKSIRNGIRLGAECVRLPSAQF